MSGSGNGNRSPANLVPGDDNSSGGGSYALSGKIMLSAVVLLLFLVVLMLALLIYARWYLLRARRRRHSSNRRRRHRSQLVFYVDHDATPASSCGLDARVLNSLPVFIFTSKTYPDSVLECAVCLSEFEEDEMGRVLPKCNHSFHSECIDLWFRSHSTCPLCRASVEESVPVSESPGEFVITISEQSGGESGSNLGTDFCVTCQNENGKAVLSAVGLGRKLSIEVPKRNIEGFVGESSGCDSGSSQSYKSPMSRMSSFKRILSRDRRGSGTSLCSSPINTTVSEAVMERGVDETRQTQS